MSKTKPWWCLAVLLIVCGGAAVAQPSRSATLAVAGHRVTMPGRWKVSARAPNSLELFIPAMRKRELVPGQDDSGSRKAEGSVVAEATMLVVTEPRVNHDEALRRLEEIAAEQPEEVRKLIIGGWPAIERTYRAPLPLTGDEDDTATGAPMTTFATTAIASGSLLVRFETTLQPDADLSIAEEALAVGRASRPATAGRTATSRFELDRLRVRLPKADAGTTDAPRPQPGGKQPEHDKTSPGVAVATQGGVGELEVLVSANGQNVVVAANPGFSFSTTSGATWTSGGGTPCNQASCDGDPSLALGQSGNMYYGWIGGPSTTQRGNGISRSTNNGQTFPFRAMAVNCPGASSCQVADQEHIAADRFNAGASGDRVYNAWRNFTGPTTLSGIRIVCSSDGGATWGTQLSIGAGDFPRVAVGRDGFVYVAFRSGGNMMLNKFSACDASNNLTQQVGFPVTVAAFTGVRCPVPGLDRCNSGNILSSPTVAADELDPSHLYYSFASETVVGNEDVILRDSSDGGATFPRSVRMNANVTGRRFMPWVSSYGGVAMVTWYDRRNATVAQNDSTRFFLGTAKPNGGTLVSLTELDLSGVNDQQCSTWPCAPRATADSDSCSVQPQLAGRCSITTATRCDFSSPACPAGQTCIVGGGCPKYGDYNGNGAMTGRAYSAWASAVAPVGATAPGAGINVYSSVDRIPSDMFIRDWTTNATTRDFGIQPSTNPNFWASGDVWNQRLSTLLPLVNDWVVGDPPSRTDTNFAFARVSRRAAAMPAAPAATATVRFSFADFGAGVAFADLGTENMTFAAADMTKFTPGHAWTVPLTASLHLCMVAELAGPDGDALAPPSVIGLSPGAGIALITADNNKAQRNLQDTIGTPGGSSEMFAIVRNDRRTKRMVRLRITVPSESLTGQIRVVGGNAVEFKRRAVLDVGELEPGQERWVQFRVALPRETKPVAVDFADDIPNGSGFTIRVATAPVEVVAARNVSAFASVLLRLAGLQQNELADQEAKEALAMTRERISAKGYAEYLRARIDAIEKLTRAHLSTLRADDAGVEEALQKLRSTTDEGNVEGAAGAHNALIERLDAHLTMLVHGRAAS